MKTIRLDKYLADAGIGTRSEVKKILKQGNITVNNEKAVKADIKIKPDTDMVCYNNKEIHYSQYEYYMLNKPAGYVSATEDREKPVVISLIKDSSHKGLFPVGRLDIDTEGLLLITDDGQLAHNLLSPAKHVEKTYYVEVDGPIKEELVDGFQKGLDIGDEKLTYPAKIQLAQAEGTAYVTIKEGRYHQIKRMFKKYDLTVTYLRRLSMGPLQLDESLKLGEFRPLTKQELETLMLHNH